MHNQASDAKWTPGLREIFDYRDLGIKDGTKGDYVAHIIRHNGKKQKDQVQHWHIHECDFQFVLVLNGWATFEYEGQGQRTIRKGDAILQTPAIKHREIACSDDFEVLEIVSPANFATKVVDPPRASRQRSRLLTWPCRSGRRHTACETMANDDILKQYEVGPVRLRGEDDYDRHLVFDHVVSLESADQRERFEAVARSLRDVLSQRWLLTQQTQDQANPKRVYYLSMEFLLGRSLANNIINLGRRGAGARGPRARTRARTGPRCSRPSRMPGSATAGSGRLAACFIDSLATMQIPATGYGLRYEYGIFRQEIENGWQVERPDPGCCGPIRGRWCARARPCTCRSRARSRWRPAACAWCATARPACSACPTTGRSSATAARRSTRLRLWGAASPDYFDFGEFSTGDFVGALVDRMAAETVTRVLYPDDSTRRRPGAALPAGVFPGLLLAGRHRQRAFAAATTGRPCPTRWRSSSTTRIRRWRWRS